jgi:hypothetical protein
VNRSLPDGELDSFVDALAIRIASFDKWAIANTKRLVNAGSLPQDVEIAAGWDACMTSITRPASQERIKALLERGFHKPGGRRRSSGISHRATRALSTREPDIAVASVLSYPIYVRIGPWICSLLQRMQRIASRRPRLQTKCRSQSASSTLTEASFFSTA